MRLKNKELVYLVHRVYNKGIIKKGGGDYIFDYLVEQGFKALVIEHPLSGAGETLVTYEKSDTALIKLYGSGPLRWIQEIIYNIYEMVKVRPNVALVLAVDPLNFFSAYILRFFYKFQIHFHAVDFTDTRFGFKLFDDFYSFMFKLAVSESDIVTYVSKLAGEKVQKMTNGKAKGYLYHLPNSPEFSKIPKMDPAQKNKYSLVYNRTHLDDFEIDMMVQIGEDLEKLGVKMKIDVLGLPCKETQNKHGVVFHGLTDYETNIKYVTESYLGVAWYRHTRSNEIYADSLKIREYAAAGIPCLGNNVLSTSAEVVERKAGVIVNTVGELAPVIKRLIENDSEYLALRQNALDWAKEVDKKVMLAKLYKDRI